MKLKYRHSASKTNKEIIMKLSFDDIITLDDLEPKKGDRYA